MKSGSIGSYFGIAIIILIFSAPALILLRAVVLSGIGELWDNPFNVAFELFALLWGGAGVFIVKKIILQLDADDFPFYEKGKKLTIPMKYVTVRKEYYRSDQQWMGTYEIRVSYTDPETNKEKLFWRGGFKFDPEPILKYRNEIIVYINPANPAMYRVETYFMGDSNGTFRQRMQREIVDRNWDFYFYPFDGTDVNEPDEKKRFGRMNFVGQTVDVPWRVVVTVREAKKTPEDVFTADDRHSSLWFTESIQLPAKKFVLLAEIHASLPKEIRDKLEHDHKPGTSGNFMDDLGSLATSRLSNTLRNLFGVHWMRERVITLDLAGSERYVFNHDGTPYFIATNDRAIADAMMTPHFLSALMEWKQLSREAVGVLLSPTAFVMGVNEPFLRPDDIQKLVAKAAMAAFAVRSHTSQ